ncbi:MAG: 50S ribosomal protein L10 [Chitinophagales bacterium]|jgi:large subunit ribosomal protein L10|nr:50S ribosomal protein L10 [Saprospirales bacterium]MBK8352816.1 50S ribosomal protein L10 [Saprospirales bacterium]MBP6659118.1 50S ribosomal protein L10 [Chitinophagales bacterium]
MTKTEKQASIVSLTDKFANSNFFYFTDTSGLTVEKINQLRRICFEKGIQLQVAKNTLIKKALVAGGKFTDDLDPVLSGPTAIMFTETGNLPARVIKQFRKSDTKPALKGAYIDSAVYIGENQLEALINVKSKEELIGDLIGLLQSPAKNVISALKSSGGKLAGIVKTLQER